jgi:hypothetical protein
MSLKRLSWRVTEKATLTGDGSLKRLPWYVTEKTTLMCHWKGYDAGWWITEKDTLMGDESLKMLLWCVTKKATLTCHWKGYDDRWQITKNATLTWTEKGTMTWTKKSSFTELYMKLRLGSGSYKSTSQERELRHIHTYRSHTMGTNDSRMSPDLSRDTG